MHVYPAEFARFVHDRLVEAGELRSVEMLTEVLSVAYQASLLRDEDRWVNFRLAIARPGPFASPSPDADPTEHHRLRFDRPRPLDAHELRRLAPAAALQRAMIGVMDDGPRGLQIWGMVRTGASWLQALEAGRTLEGRAADGLAVVASGPGRLRVSLDGVTLAKLTGGVLSGASPDVFDSRWLPAACADDRREIFDAHLGARQHNTPAPDPGILRVLDQQLVRRIIARVRHARHGGTIVLLPQSRADEVATQGRPIALKYRFVDDASRRRYRALQLRLLQRLSLHAEHGDGRMPDWRSGPGCGDPVLAAIDEALLELAHTIAALAEVDGAVVVSKQFEIMGFGGEILGDLPDVPTVLRALDLEGDERVAESTEGVGTRHRSLYRLCAAVPDALGIVVSQDGGVRLVASKNGAVTYWDQLGTAPMEI